MGSSYLCFTHPSLCTFVLFNRRIYLNQIRRNGFLGLEMSHFYLLRLLQLLATVRKDWISVFACPFPLSNSFYEDYRRNTWCIVVFLGIAIWDCPETPLSTRWWQGAALAERNYSRPPDLPSGHLAFQVESGFYFPNLAGQSTAERLLRLSVAAKVLNPKVLDFIRNLEPNSWSFKKKPYHKWEVHKDSLFCWQISTAQTVNQIRNKVWLLIDF